MYVSTKIDLFFICLKCYPPVNIVDLSFIEKYYTC